MPPRALQYADDTIMLMEGSLLNVNIIKEILSIFSSISGLNINNTKSLFVPINIPTSACQLIQHILQCQNAQLPVNYLGLPLSIRRCKKIHFKPLIDAFQTRLDGWQARLLSPGGRLTLIKSILTALPLHYMQVFKLPAWLIKHMEGLRRSFFWKGRSKCLGGHCLVNWTRCCLPKSMGGLGILNLAVQNQALLTKWLWKLKNEPNSIWTNTVMSFYGTTEIQHLLQVESTSFALKDILHCSDFFSASTTPRTNGDGVDWRWTSTATFSASSAYEKLIDVGMRSHFHQPLWKIKAPPKVKIFNWLLLNDRILTQSNLALRGWPSIQACLCCTTGAIETTDHLFLQCDMAAQIWNVVQHYFRLAPIIFSDTVLEFWTTNRRHQGTNWDIIWAAVSWSIWKERNARIFSSKTTMVFQIMQLVVATVDTWKRML